MALKKSIETESGVTGEYWRVTDINYRPKHSLCFNVSLYVNKAARDAGKEPMTIRGYAENGTDIEGCAVTYCYNLLKSGEFSDAIDC